VTIRQNRISNTTHAAAVYVVTEKSYGTSNIRNVLVEDNTIIAVQTTAPAYNPIQRHIKTGHGAVEIGSELDTQSVAEVMIRRNRISETARDGMRIRGKSCAVGLEANTLTAIGGSPIRIDTAVGPDCQIACLGNTYNGPETSDTRCAGQPLPTVVGAAP
jgi:hypothetical protein